VDTKLVINVLNANCQNVAVRTYISQLVHEARFTNNILQVRSKSKYWKETKNK